MSWARAGAGGARPLERRQSYSTTANATRFTPLSAIAMLPSRVTIMLKDKKKHALTGGWGFQAWAGGDPTKPLVTDPTKQCFECHRSKKDQDYVYSTYIP